MSLYPGSRAVTVVIAALAGCRVEAHQVKSDGPRPQDPQPPATTGPVGPPSPPGTAPQPSTPQPGMPPSGDASPQRNCGGIAGFRCPPDMYCAYGRFQKCGSGDAMALCKPRPEICTEEYRPVCGCDGKDYGNECAAARAGTSVLKDGPCK